MVAFWKNFPSNHSIERINFDISDNLIDEKGVDSIAYAIKK